MQQSFLAEHEIPWESLTLNRKNRIPVEKELFLVLVRHPIWIQSDFRTVS